MSKATFGHIADMNNGEGNEFENCGGICTKTEEQLQEETRVHGEWFAAMDTYGRWSPEAEAKRKELQKLTNR